MKKWLHDTVPQIHIEKILSLVLVGDAEHYEPRDEYISASKKPFDKDYTSLSREQLLQLSKKELERVHDVNVLRKLRSDELTILQRREVTQANLGKFQSSKSEVANVLEKLRSQKTVFVWPTSKNQTFLTELQEKGCDATPRDVRNIIAKLNVSDYKYSTLSYLDTNWNALLMVFRFDDTYTFNSYEGDGTVTVDNLEIYIKIDVETETGNGYAAMSFHRPEF